MNKRGWCIFILRKYLQPVNPHLCMDTLVAPLLWLFVRMHQFFFLAESLRVHVLGCLVCVCVCVCVCVTDMSVRLKDRMTDDCHPFLGQVQAPSTDNEAKAEGRPLIQLHTATAHNASNCVCVCVCVCVCTYLYTR